MEFKVQLAAWERWPLAGASSDVRRRPEASVPRRSRYWR